MYRNRFFDVLINTLYTIHILRNPCKLYFKRKPKAASAAQPRKPKPKRKPRKSVGAKETKKSSPKAVALKKPPEKTQKSEL